MAERVAANPQIMRRRKAIIEHCFGTIKRSLGYDYFLCRGMRHVTMEVKHKVGRTLLAVRWSSSESRRNRRPKARGKSVQVWESERLLCR